MRAHIARLIGAAAFLVAALFSFMPEHAHGQATPLQAGPWAPGHAPMYATPSFGQPIVQDSGSAAGGATGTGLSELGMTVRGTGTAPFANAGLGPLATNFCDYDAPTTGPFHYLCFSPNAQGGGLITYGAGGGAPTLPFSFNINGSAIQFPFALTGIVGPASTTIGDFACWNNTVGTLLSDCTVSISGLGALGSNQTWTGTNTFSNTVTLNGTVKVGATTESFPGSGQIVGTSDTQTLTNKSIAASEINSGQLAVAQGGTGLGSLTANNFVVGNGASSPAFFPVANAGGTVATTRNLKITQASNTTLTILADELVVETSLGGTSYKVSGLNLTWNAATTGAGGMDTGSLPASGYVALYAMFNPAGPTLSVVGTTASQTTIYGGANAPSGYTTSALIGIWPTNGSSQLAAGTQLDRKFFYTGGGVNVATGVNVPSSITSQSISSAVPAAAKTCDGMVGITSTGVAAWVEIAADTASTGVQQFELPAGATSTNLGFGSAANFYGLPILTSQTAFWESNFGASIGRLTVTAFTF